MITLTELGEDVPRKLVVSFFVPGFEFSWREKRKTKTARLPTPKGNHPHIRMHGSRPSVSPTPRTQAAQDTLTKNLLHMASVMDPGLLPLTNPVHVDVTFWFEPPKSWPEWKRRAAAAGAIKPSGKGVGDVTNLAKLFEDAFERAGWVADDAQIVGGWRAKRYGWKQGYQVEVYDLGPQCSRSKWRGLSSQAGGGAA